jgi:hypothetical protein
MRSSGLLLGSAHAGKNISRLTSAAVSLAGYRDFGVRGSRQARSLELLGGAQVQMLKWQMT